MISPYETTSPLGGVRRGCVITDGKSGTPCRGVHTDDKEQKGNLLMKSSNNGVRISELVSLAS
ncbi:MAG: hypothetical protein K2M53_04265 [Muribaculaceae bacterium]|nr:hypothetical protein [Muribaculaceae bacterium]